jgi:hypothetical protein
VKDSNTATEIKFLRGRQTQVFSGSMTIPVSRWFASLIHVLSAWMDSKRTPCCRISMWMALTLWSILSRHTMGSLINVTSSSTIKHLANMKLNNIAEKEKKLFLCNLLHLEWKWHQNQCFISILQVYFNTFRSQKLVILHVFFRNIFPLNSFLIQVW